MGSEGVRNDILNYVRQATSKGWMESNAEMKIKSPVNGNGFDYDRIRVVGGNEIDIGNGHTLSIENFQEPAECGNTTILYSEKFQMLFAGDLLYNSVFNWLGTADHAAVGNWIQILKKLKGRFNQPGTLIFLGMGNRVITGYLIQTSSI